MKRLAMVNLILAIAISIVGNVSAQEEPIPQTVCPVMGREINKEIYVDYEGRRVYFCCASCREKFNKDPRTYIKKLEEEGVTLEKAPVPQTICPVMGREINKLIYADYEGKRVYFCCASCREKFNEDPEKYMAKLRQEGVALEESPMASPSGSGEVSGQKEAEPIPQTVCPVMGKEINKKIYADYDGNRVYFCCASCREKFNKDPERYIEKLEEDDVTLEKTPGA